MCVCVRCMHGMCARIYMCACVSERASVRVCLLRNFIFILMLILFWGLPALQYMPISFYDQVFTFCWDVFMEHFYDIRIGIFFYFIIFSPLRFFIWSIVYWNLYVFGTIHMRRIFFFFLFLKIENNDILWYDKNLFS